MAKAKTDSTRTFAGVHFKAVSIGKGTASITASLPKAEDDGAVQDMAALLVRARLDVKLEVKPDDEQPALINGALPSMSSVADTGKLAVDNDGYDVRLVFQKASVDLAMLGEFANARGRLVCKRIGDATHGADVTDGNVDE